LNKKLKYIGIIISILVLIIIIVLNLNNGIKTLELKNVIKRSDIETIGTKYFCLGANIFTCTNEDIRLTNIDSNKILWSEKINLINIIYKKVDNKFAVASKYGYQIYVFNEKGKQIVFNIGKPIVDFTMNKKGYIAAIQEDENRNIITVYSDKGKKIIERITYSDKSGRTMSCSLSDDNNYLAIAYLRADGSGINSELEFLNIKSEELIDNVYATQKYKDRIIYNIAYHSGNDLFALSDKEIFNINILKNIVKQEVLENNLDNVFLDESANKFIALKANKQSNKQRNLVIYDTKTLKVNSIELKEDVTYLKYDKGNIMVNQKNMLYCFNLSGNNIWKIKMPQNFSDILTVNKSKIVVISGNKNSVYEIR